MGQREKLGCDVVKPWPQLVLQVVLELEWLFRVVLNGGKEAGLSYLLNVFGLLWERQPHSCLCISEGCSHGHQQPPLTMGE